MQQIRPRYKLARRLLFPYSGEEPLARRQALRVIVAWALSFPLVLSLCALPVAIALMRTVMLQKVVLFFLLTFLSGVVIFGSLACLVVYMINRAARIYQQRKQTSDTNGGRYGS
jgi:hypothetical protein